MNECSLVWSWARSIWDSTDWTDGVVKSPSKENDKAHGFGRFEHVDGDVGGTQRTWKRCTGAHWYTVLGISGTVDTMIWWHDSFPTIKPTCKKRLRVERPRGDSWTPCAYPYPKSLGLETITQFSGNIGVWRDAVSTSSYLSGSLWKGLLPGFWGWKFRRSYAASILIIQQLVWYSNSLQSLEFQCEFRAIVLQNTECEPFKTKGLLDLFVPSVQWPVPRLRHNRSTKGNGSWTKLMVKGSAPWWCHWDSLRKRSSGPEIAPLHWCKWRCSFFKASIRIPFSPT